MTERFSASDPTGEWVTVTEAARRLGISRQAVQQRYERGVLPRRGGINAPAGEPSIIEVFIRDPNTVSVQARVTPVDADDEPVTEPAKPTPVSDGDLGTTIAAAVASGIDSGVQKLTDAIANKDVIEKALDQAAERIAGHLRGQIDAQSAQLADLRSMLAQPMLPASASSEHIAELAVSKARIEALEQRAVDAEQRITEERDERRAAEERLRTALAGSRSVTLMIQLVAVATIGVSGAVAWMLLR